LLLDRGVHRRSTAYDLAAAAERVRATAYPGADEFAADHILHPPSEAEMQAVFDRAASGG
ncbi:MAG TPA: hypothetical protein VE173_01530, partial [Longimicrobiales bacterium]|nr:hypothetical protein [Longimicrobiales bacterium]